MTHYFEKTIVDCKEIYTDYLIGAVAPTLYHGFKQIYRDAQEMENDYIEGEKINPKVKNPGVLKIFQYYVIGIEKWSDSMAEMETQRVRNDSGCADIFDDLIKAVIKSHILVLTYSASDKTCKIINEKLHEKIEPNYFIHSCYVECGRIFIDHPTLFYHDFSNLVLKENERKIYQLIKIGIKNGIKRVLPMRKILTEYLSKDYIEVENKTEEYLKIKNMIHGKNQSSEDVGGRMKLMESSESSATNNFGDFDDNYRNEYDKNYYLEEKANEFGGHYDDFESLIYGIKPDDTIDIEIIQNSPKTNKQSEITKSVEQPIKQNIVEDIEKPMEHIETVKQIEKSIDTIDQVEHESINKEKQSTENQTQNKNDLILSQASLKLPEERQEQNIADEIEELFGKPAKKGKKSSKSILSEAFDAAKNTDANDDINIVKNYSNYSNNSVTPEQKKENDKFFNNIAKI